MLKRRMSLLKNKKGYTLVELVVTFALLSIFSVCAAYVISSAMTVYQSVSGRAYAQTVTQTLMEKITGEISGAQPGAEKQYGITVSDGTAGADSLNFSNGACIAFCSRSGSQIYITSDNGRVLLHYRPVNGSDQKLKAVDWKFDDAVYNGFDVESLAFSIIKKDGAATNVIQVNIKLKNKQTGYEYSDTRYAQCFNYEDTTSAAKISYGKIKQDGAE